MAVTRRHFLIGGVAAAGLVVAWQILPRDYPNPLFAAPGESLFGAYLKIATDGSVTVAVPQCEMGQGVTTIIPQIVAEELGADWRSVAVELVPVSPIYANHVLARQWADLLWPESIAGMFGEDTLLADHLSDSAKFMLTADSTTLPNYEQPAREAGAAARSLLCQAAAARWNVAWEECETRGGFVVHAEKRLRFAELLEEAKTFDVPDPVPVRGTFINDRAIIDDALPPYPRLDLPGKVDGSLNFAGDIRLPDMVYAAIRQGPLGDSTLKSVRRSAAKNVTGLLEIVRHERWVAAVATNWWAANTALSNLKATFETRGRMADSKYVETAMDAALSGEEGTGGKRLYARGDIDPVFAAGKGFAATYTVAPSPHATIETSTATARFVAGQLELWLATQSPELARQSAARVLAISAANVVLYPVMAGGSFDRRLENEVAVQAALLARHMGRPVQLVWSRGEEMIHDPVRPPVRARLAAVTGSNGLIAALSTKIAAPATAHEFARRLFEYESAHEALKATSGQYDYMAVSGAVPPYTIADFALDHYPVDISIPTGRYRANADGYTCFFTESFIDELAHKANREPLSFRMQMLSGQPRLARCLSGVAIAAGWDGGLDNSGQGIACHSMKVGERSAHIGVIATARQGEQGFAVKRLTALADIGRVINRDIALQQIESGIVFGLATAMGCTTGYEKGVTTVRQLRDLNLPMLSDVPELVVELIDSTEEPVDPGEIGVPAVAPAIANALFSASGLRLRSLPLLSDGL